jgi:hypothetical protein
MKCKIIKIKIINTLFKLKKSACFKEMLRMQNNQKLNFIFLKYKTYSLELYYTLLFSQRIEQD